MQHKSKPELFFSLHQFARLIAWEVNLVIFVGRVPDLSNELYTLMAPNLPAEGYPLACSLQTTVCICSDCRMWATRSADKAFPSKGFPHCNLHQSAYLLRSQDVGNEVDREKISFNELEGQGGLWCGLLLSKIEA